MSQNADFHKINKPVHYPCNNKNAIGDCTLSSCDKDPTCPNNIWPIGALLKDKETGREYILELDHGNNSLVMRAIVPTVGHKDKMRLVMKPKQAPQVPPQIDFLGGTYCTGSQPFHVFIISRLAQDFVDPNGKAHPKGCYIGLVLEMGKIGIWSKDGKSLTLDLIPKDTPLDLTKRVGQRPY